ncbi:MAG: metallophosphoesterase [Oscillospiraceae bacterium]|nr:metallophosphoesterase [Oscillospiraceae bacterium]
MIYAIADPHLSFGTAKPMDIFPGWDNHAQRLEANWRKLVRDDDTVVLPGDISWGMTLDQALPDFQFLHNLPGRQKVILKGNHDYWFSTRRKIEDLWTAHGLTSLVLLHNNAIEAEGMAICGSRGWFFDSDEPHDTKVLAREAGRLRTSIQAGKQLSDNVCVFLHYPPITQDRVCEEIDSVLRDEGVARCYYGHLHSSAAKRAFVGERNGTHYDIVSADALGFCPKLITPPVLRDIPL